MKQIIQVVLACRHTLEFVATHAPGPDETELWCRKCGKMVYRFGELDPWVLKCMSCQYARNFGGDKLTAFSSAMKHRTSRNHTVRLTQGEKTEYIRHAAGMQQLALEDGNVPF